MMSTSPTSNNSPRRKPASISTPRYEVILDSKPWERLSLEDAWGELRTLSAALPKLAELRALSALGHRVGFALGHAYARAAGSVLAKLERIEDATAERKYRQKSKSKS